MRKVYGLNVSHESVIKHKQVCIIIPLLESNIYYSGKIGPLFTEFIMHIAYKSYFVKHRIRILKICLLKKFRKKKELFSKAKD